MKKIFLLSLLLTVTILLNSCSTDVIESIKVDEITYRTVYLYSFKDAQIEGVQPNYLPMDPPTANGYVYSCEKLSPGDTIRVWTNFRFGDVGNSLTYSDLGTNAIVVELIETYSIKLERKSDTYKITYYPSTGLGTFHEGKEITELTKHTFEVVKERVTIYYE